LNGAHGLLADLNTIKISMKQKEGEKETKTPERKVETITISTGILVAVVPN
jgi:hypothetical protein